MLCPGERVIGLYKEATGKSAVKIAKTVKAWFREKAAEEGWASVHFLPEVQTNHGAGCILWLPPLTVNVKVLVKKTTLVFEAETGD